MADCPAADAWRGKQRVRLAALCAELSETSFRDQSKMALSHADRALTGQWHHKFGLYWPRPREIALFPLIRRMLEAGGVPALRSPAKKPGAMTFRAWTPGDSLVAGGEGFCSPRDGPLVRPHVVFLPLLGFDEENFRLGYGGGSYDRLLTREPRPYTIGVGFEFMCLKSVQPLARDIRLDCIVTEAGLRTRVDFRFASGA